jgi:hypothetical protein
MEDIHRAVILIQEVGLIALGEGIFVVSVDLTRTE